MQIAYQKEPFTMTVLLPIANASPSNKDASSRSTKKKKRDASDNDEESGVKKEIKKTKRVAVDDSGDDGKKDVEAGVEAEKSPLLKKMVTTCKDYAPSL